MVELGLQIPATKLAELGDLGLPEDNEEEFLSGPTLGLVLRRLIQGLYSIDDAKSWVGMGLTLLSQVDNQDWKTGGYTSMSAWLTGTRPGGMSKTRCLGLMTFWKSTAPRILAAGYALDDILSRLERGSIEEMASLLSHEGADARLAKVICSLVMSGRLQTVDEFRAVKKSTAFLNATTVMDIITAGNVDPVDTYVEMATVDDDITPRITQVAQFLLSVGIPHDDLPSFVSQAMEMPLDRIAVLLHSPHGKSIGAVSHDARILEEEIAADLGDVDTHTRAIIEVEETSDGYYRVTRNTVLSRALLRKLWSTRGFDVIIDGKHMSFGGE